MGARRAVAWIDFRLSEVSNLGQSAGRTKISLGAMYENVAIVGVEQDGREGLIVVFSDGTQAGYLVQELLDLRPNRESAAGTNRLIKSLPGPSLNAEAAP